MSRRNKAIHLLKMFRDELADALTDAVLDNDEWRNLDGFSMSDEKVIELGDRLWRVNQIINSMPPEAVAAESSFTQPTGNQLVDLAPFVITQGVPRPTWDDFVREIEDENRNTASRILGEIAQLDPQLAFQATNVFAAQYVLLPEFKSKAMSLRAQLRCGAAGSVQLIHDLFGITGAKATEIYNSLRVAV